MIIVIALIVLGCSIAITLLLLLLYKVQRWCERKDEQDNKDEQDKLWLPPPVWGSSLWP